MDCPQHENGAGGEDEECCEGGSGCGSGDGETTTATKITTKITSTTTTEQYTCQDGSMIPITKVCNLYNRPIHSSVAFWISLSCLIGTTSITQQLRIEIIITDRGKCFCRCVTALWTALYMKVGLEGRTRRIAMVSTFKIWVTKYSSALVLYSRKWKWKW